MSHQGLGWRLYYPYLVKNSIFGDYLMIEHRENLET
jgi:hypothetical protein